MPCYGYIISKLAKIFKSFTGKQMIRQSDDEAGLL